MLQIIYVQPEDPGWTPITMMVQLMAKSMNANLCVVPASVACSNARKMSAYVPRRRGADPLLLVAPEPTNLQKILTISHWFPGNSITAAWVFDSWWDDRIPHVARHGKHFDIFYVTEYESVEPWHNRTNSTVRYLPWGTDTVRVGWTGEQKTTDLLRVGRQPPAWSDDTQTQLDASAVGVDFLGRPPFAVDHLGTANALYGQLKQAKYVLAFSNKLSPAKYTHPTREYLTGRWMDALAAGCIVAGAPPACQSARELLWDGAVLLLPHDDRLVGLDVLAQQLRGWTEERARLNVSAARATLDWRRRFQVIAGDLGVDTSTLDMELEMINGQL